MVSSKHYIPIETLRIACDERYHSISPRSEIYQLSLVRALSLPLFKSEDGTYQGRIVTDHEFIVSMGGAEKLAAEKLKEVVVKEAKPVVA